MSRITTFADVTAVLAGFVPKSGTKSVYSLGRMVALMEFLGNPQDKLKVVHIAGTSGKTSTCYYIAALLKAAGKKVGLTISPHISEVNERLQIDLVPLPKKEFCEKLEKFLKIIAECGVTPTYFELLIAFAYYEFARQQVDYAVIEVGLGGLRDGTNVVSRADKVCILTDIGLDHIKVLGSTLREITAQKAGIIKKGNAVFCYRQTNEVINVIQNRCDEQDANLHIIDDQKNVPELDFLPLFQRRNFGLAEKTVSYILKRDHTELLSFEKLLTAAQVLIPARMEIFKRGEKIIILDGAHNAQKLHALARSIKAQFPNLPVAVLLSFVAGGEYRLEPALAEVASFATAVITTSFQTEQDISHASVEPTVIANLLVTQSFTEVQVEPDTDESVKLLLGRPEPLLLVTGSFYLLNYIRPLMLGA